jgi:AcrR family transcriptional regulator
LYCKALPAASRAVIEYDTAGSTVGQRRADHRPRENPLEQNTACRIAAVGAVDTSGRPRHARTTPTHTRHWEAAMTAARLPATPTLSDSDIPTTPKPVDLADSDSERRQRERNEWLQAGYAILADRGPKALTIPALCRRMGVKATSFQRNFGTLKAYRGVLARSWASLCDTERARFARISKSPPRQRLSLIGATLTSKPHWLLERAMREWARADAMIGAGVRAADQRIVDVMAAAFLDAGFDRAEAELRANAAFAAYVGFLHLSGSTPSPLAAALREPFLDLLFRQAGPLAPPCLEQS